MHCNTWLVLQKVSKTQLIKSREIMWKKFIVDHHSASNKTAEDEQNGECRKNQRNNKCKQIRELNHNRKIMLAKVRVTHVHGPLKLQSGVGQQM